jgi:hypothetical protein
MLATFSVGLMLSTRLCLFPYASCTHDHEGGGRAVGQHVMSSASFDSKELLQHDDDAVVCAFGPDFFNGARYGAGGGSLTSFLFAWRAYREIKTARMTSMLNSGTRLVNLPRLKFFATMTYGFRMQPLYASGVMACSLTGVAKLVKFYLASGRVNEFLLDDVEFEELQAWAKQSPETAKVFTDFCNDSLASLKPQNHSVDVATAASPTLSDRLIAKHGNAKRELHMGDQLVRRRPNFRDGVAVGLFGSIMDCYLPTKPESMYYDCCFGVMSFR